MSVGAFLLLPECFGRDSAQIGVFQYAGFAPRGSRRMLALQAHLSSTVARVQVQNRYPSPLKRSVLSGGPLFFCAASAWHELADTRLGVRAVCRANLPSRICGEPKSGSTCFVCGYLKGEQICVDHSSYSDSLHSARPFRHATRMRNAALSVRRVARPSLRQQAATRLQARSLVAQPVFSATTQAFVNKTTHIAASRLPDTHDRCAEMRSGFSVLTRATAQKLGT